MNTVTFKNKETALSNVLGKIISIQKGSTIIRGRFLRGESKNIFKLGVFKTKKNALRQFILKD